VRAWTPGLLGIALLLVQGCSEQADPGDSGQDVEDGLDAADEGEPGDEGDPGPADGDPTTLPLGLEAVYRVSGPGGVDVGSAAWVEADGRLWVAWERFDAAFTSSALWLASSADGAAWSPPGALLAGGPAYRASPSSATLAGQGWVYFAEAADLYGQVSLRRARVAGGAAGTPEALATVPGLGSLLSWPRFLALSGGRVALAFRDGSGRPRVAYSADGVLFDPPVTVHTGAAAMAALGQAPDGWLAYAYQTGTGGSMSSWVRTSADGQAWDEPVEVSASSTNVHDTTLVPRLDGGLDLYYIWPCSAAGFCLHRRALAADGSLGPEQQVTLPEVGETSKPEGLRLPDGRLLLLWAEISQRGAGGEPSEQILSGCLLAGDAPPVE